MLNLREEIEDDELRSLAPHAARSTGPLAARRRTEPADPLRTAFQRDRDRVIHSTAFRRLQHKTQVVAAFEGDHFRSRLTHSLEVSQMARGVARALRLNTDLAEAVALGHDLGHPPFGHVGERVLDELMADHGGFRHNGQGTRIVDTLEDRAGDGLGLNLTFGVRRSLLKRRMPDRFPLTADLREALDAEPPVPAPLEARVVDLCDRIAYLAHDLDDGLRANVFETADAASLRIWSRVAEAVDTDRPNRIVSGIIALMIEDLVRASAAKTARAREGRITHSEEITVMAQELLEFLSERFYRSRSVLAVMELGEQRIRAAFAHYVEHPDELPAKSRARLHDDGVERAVCDYIAGMTDRYLMQLRH